MIEVYLLNCLRVDKTLDGDYVNGEEVLTGVYESFDLAEEDGEKFIENGDFEAYEIKTWQVIGADTKAPRPQNKNRFILCDEIHLQ